MARSAAPIAVKLRPRTPHLSPVAAWALVLAAFPVASRAGSTSLAVSLGQDENAAVQVRVRIPSGQEPDVSWSGTAQAGPYRLALAWQGASVTLNGALPTVPSGGVGPIQAVALRNTQDQARLELQLDRAIQPSLRRVGDSWILTLKPVALPPGAARTAASQQPEMLLLDMTVNGQRQPVTARAEQWPDGALLVAGDAWAEARLAPAAQPRTLSDGTPAYALQSLPDVRYRVDRGRLSLDIDAPPGAFVASKLEMPEAASQPLPRPEPGVMVNYDVSAARSGPGRQLTGGATVEAVAFSGWGNFVTSGLVSDDGLRRTATRLDSYWRYDMPQRMESLSVGDTVGTGGGWSRPARYAGVRWGRNFGLRPGFVTLPQLSLSGQAALPSVVDVLVNNVQRTSQPVQPGPFEITNVPVVTGAGELNLVVRDLLGRQTVVTQSYYASPSLLAPGLTDFSFEAGRLRTGYGQDNRYGDSFGAGTLRAGWTPRLTGEVRLELQAARRAAGLQLAGLLGDWGTGRAALAASSGSTQNIGERGQLLQVGIERTSMRGGASLQYERATRGFAPFGEAADAAAPAQRSREQWLAGISGRPWGSVTTGLSYVRQTRWNGDTVASLGLSVGTSLGQSASLSVALNKRIDDSGTWTAAVNIDVALDKGVHTAGRVEREAGGRLVAAAAASQSAPAGPGIGWQAEASTQASQRARGALQYNSNHAEWALDVAADASGQVSARAGGRGTVGLVAGVPFATRPVGDASVAVVQVGGVPGVPVKRSNQVVAYTDERGLAFVAGLVPWHKNQIEIDPADLPMDVDLSETVKEVVPYARSGAVVRFEARKSRQALVVLQQPGGTPVPIGAQVRLLPKGPEFLAGRRGEVWLTDLTDGAQRIRVSWPDGGCELDLALPAGKTPDRIGPLVCGKGAR